MKPFTTLLVEETRQCLQGGAGLAAGFFAAAACLLPLGVGPDVQLLSHMAAGGLWVLAALAALLSLDRLFAADAEDGSLELLALSPLSLEGIAGIKILAHWLSTGVPLILLSALLALMFALPLEAIAPLLFSLVLGTPAVSAVGAVGAALTLSARRGGLLLPLIVLPLIAPAVIFGAGMVLPGAGGGVYFLCAFVLMALLLSPFAVAAALRLHLAQ